MSRNSATDDSEDVMLTEAILRALAEIVGDRHVSTERADLIC